MLYQQQTQKKTKLNAAAGDAFRISNDAKLNTVACCLSLIEEHVSTSALGVICSFPSQRAETDCHHWIEHLQRQLMAFAAFTQARNKAQKNWNKKSMTKREKLKKMQIWWKHKSSVGVWSVGRRLKKSNALPRQRYHAPTALKCNLSSFFALSREHEKKGRKRAPKHMPERIVRFFFLFIVLTFLRFSPSQFTVVTLFC